MIIVECLCLLRIASDGHLVASCSFGLTVLQSDSLALCLFWEVLPLCLAQCGNSLLRPEMMSAQADLFEREQVWKWGKNGEKKGPFQNVVVPL